MGGTRTDTAVRARLTGWATGVLAIAAADLAAAEWAEDHLTGRHAPPVGAVGVGVVFDHGPFLPVGSAWLGVMLLVGCIAALTAFALRVATTASRLRAAALVLLLGGLSADLIDRLGDDTVTDYLYLTPWPNEGFNIADLAVAAGVVAFVATVATRGRRRPG
ncbi:signal peptidase II [Yinghuangia sp. ASG 101]|uniref:signal peptidase II n=1 Tax=Yinghuangia sp. ASG 101 TaxID=2896848 RepID=UPI001E416B33|nr:signal peptidase II [Yinghuangia sp. ASG 101]UGQ11576.1 signal peptidase II [Yinghuangia sp. ASG 101]